MDYSDSEGSESEDDIDPENYKGIFYNMEQENKYQDPVSGAHFKYQDMYTLLSDIKLKRDKEDAIYAKQRQSKSKCEDHYTTQDQFISIPYKITQENQCRRKRKIALTKLSK
jgi:hypothetical protein